jgi:hypothetical protein
MMGSSVALNVIDKETCDLGPPTNPGNGKIGNFQLVTASDQFSYQDAVNSKLTPSAGDKSTMTDSR